MIERNDVNQEKALLVGVIQPGTTESQIHEHLDELELLAETAGAKIAGRITQRVSKINPATFIGKGKAEEILITGFYPKGCFQTIIFFFYNLKFFRNNYFFFSSMF